MSAMVAGSWTTFRCGMGALWRTYSARFNAIPLAHTPCAWGYSPVSRLAREGIQTEFETMCRSNTVP